MSSSAASSESTTTVVEGASAVEDSSAVVAATASSTSPTAQLLLFDAVKNGELDTVKSLLSPTSSKDSTSTTPLSINVCDGGGFTPLILAAQCSQLAVLRWLLSQDGIDVHAETDAGNTAFMFACTKDNVDAVKELLEHGSDFFATNRNHDNCFLLACAGGHLHVVQFMLDAYYAILKAKQDMKREATSSGASASLALAASSLPPIPSKRWLSSRNQEGLTALQCATQSGNMDVVKVVLQAIRKEVGVEWDVDTQGEPDARKHFFPSIWSDGLVGIQVSPASGIRDPAPPALQSYVNAANVMGDTALHIAAELQREDIFFYIVESTGADPMKPNRRGKICLQLFKDTPVAGITADDGDDDGSNTQKQKQNEKEKDNGSTESSSTPRSPFTGLCLAVERRLRHLVEYQRELRLKYFEEQSKNSSRLFEELMMEEEEALAAAAMASGGKKNKGGKSKNKQSKSSDAVEATSSSSSAAEKKKKKKKKANASTATSKEDEATSKSSDKPSDPNDQVAAVPPTSDPTTAAKSTSSSPTSSASSSPALSPALSASSSSLLSPSASPTRSAPTVKSTLSASAPPFEPLNLSPVATATANIVDGDTNDDTTQTSSSAFSSGWELVASTRQEKQAKKQAKIAAAAAAAGTSTDRSQASTARSRNKPAHASDAKKFASHKKATNKKKKSSTNETLQQSPKPTSKASSAAQSSPVVRPSSSSTATVAVSSIPSSSLTPSSTSSSSSFFSSFDVRPHAWRPLFSLQSRTPKYTSPPSQQDPTNTAASSTTAASVDGPASTSRTSSSSPSPSPSSSSSSDTPSIANLQSLFSSLHPHIDSTDLLLSHLLGSGWSALSMSQLGVLEEVYQQLSRGLKEAQTHLMWQQQQEIMNELIRTKSEVHSLRREMNQMQQQINSINSNSSSSRSQHALQQAK